MLKSEGGVSTRHHNVSGKTEINITSVCNNVLCLDIFIKHPAYVLAFDYLQRKKHETHLHDVQEITSGSAALHSAGTAIGGTLHACMFPRTDVRSRCEP